MRAHTAAARIQQCMRQRHIQRCSLAAMQQSAPEPGSPRLRPVVPLASGPSMWVLTMPGACGSSLLAMPGVSDVKLPSYGAAGRVEGRKVSSL